MTDDRVQRLLTQLAARTGVAPVPLLELSDRSGRADVRQLGDVAVISYPARRAATQPDAEIAAILAHELHHIAAHDLTPPAKNRRDVIRLIVPSQLATAGLAVAVVAASSVWLLLPLLLAVSIVLGLNVGLALMRRRDLREHGLDLPRVELAADLGAARIVGAGVMARALQRPIWSSTSERLSAKLIAAARFAYPSHPPLSTRVAALSAYDGSDPREFARTF